MLEKDSGQPIQGMPLSYGMGAVSPYTVEATDSVIEFLETGEVTVVLGDGTTVVGNVLSGGRYAIVRGTKTITFGGTFNIG